MNSIMSQTPHDSSLSFSRRHFHWIISRVEGAVSSTSENEEILGPNFPFSAAPPLPPPKSPLAKLRSLLSPRSPLLGPRFLGTLYGSRRANARFAFQTHSRSIPALIIEVEISMGSLVKAMASGVVRVALECERGERGEGKGRLIEERRWRAYCNGRKCGAGVRRDCGAGDGRVAKAVEMVTMGAGVLPEEGEGEREVMYMRAKFERVVGSKDSEVFYMMSMDGKGGGAELSIYFLRV